MVEAIMPPPTQGIISTQMERVQNDKPVATEPPKAKAPPPPPPETGRGGNIDKTT